MKRTPRNVPAPSVHRAGCAFAALLAAVVCSCATGERPQPPPAGSEVLYKYTISRGTVTELEQVGVFPAGVLRSIGRMHGEGEMFVNVLDPAGGLLFTGSTLDPRRFSADDFSGATRRGETGLFDSVAAFAVVPAPPTGLGSVRFVLQAPDAPGTPTEFVVDVRRGTTAERTLGLLDGPVTHFAGSTDAEDSFLVLFVPSGYDDLDEFHAAAQHAVDGLPAVDWYEDHMELFSFWTYDSSILNRTAVFHCAMSALVPIELAAASAEAYVLTAGAEFGSVRRSPDLIVFVANQECRAAALGSFILVDRNVAPLILAHEMGHAMGDLDDEYEEEGRPCTGHINTAPLADIGWQCLLQSRPYAASCPDGSSVGAYPPVLSCDSWGRPCPQCLMNDHNSGIFCPVCRARLDLVFNVLHNGLRYADVPETCNGIDDNEDGQTDETCECDSPTCPATPEVCEDGIDNDCDGATDEPDCASSSVCGNDACEGPGETCRSCEADCGVCGSGCGNHVCEPPGEDCASCATDCGACGAVCGNSACEPPGETCSTCPGDCGACGAVCANGTCEFGETCSSCPADCGSCPPTCPNGACDAGETCSSCPADCGSCGPVCSNGVCESGETCSSCPADCGSCTPDCSWYSCSGTCWPTGTPNTTACATTGGLACSEYYVQSVCDSHAPACAWYLCTSSCWPTGTANDVACNTCDAYTTVAQCDSHAPTCAWYGCSNSCWNTGTPNDVACTCWPTGDALADRACCGGFDSVSACDAHRPLCAWYACTDSCWPTGTSNDLACNSCSGYRTTAECNAH